MFCRNLKDLVVADKCLQILEILWDPITIWSELMQNRLGLMQIVSNSFKNSNKTIGKYVKLPAKKATSSMQIGSKQIKNHQPLGAIRPRKVLCSPTVTVP